MSGRPFASFSLVACLAACSADPPAATADAAVSNDIADAPRDVAPDVPIDRAPPPYDAGTSPACAVAAFTRHIVDQSPGVNVIETGGLVAVGDGFVFALRQGASRLIAPDGGPARRDTVDVMAVSAVGLPQSALTTVYDSAAAGTDLSPPTLVRAGGNALVLFRESSGFGAPGTAYVTRVRGTLLDAAGARTGPAIVLEDRGDPFAATLPDGTAFVLSPRVVSRSDAGLVAASPNVVRILASGAVANPLGVDIASIVPIEADSVLMLPAPDGAALMFRRATELRVVRFDGTGLIDTRVRVTRDLDAVRLDDGAVLPEGVVAAWDEPAGSTHAIHVAVTDPEGVLLTHQIVERYEGTGSPVVSVSRTHGGAAVMWVRGSGDAALLRAMVMQPNGVMRSPPRDLLPVPGADGRLYAVSDGRALTFVARDRGAMGYGVTFGRLCLPE